MFDSKGGEVVGPKASPTHNNTKIHKFKILEDFKLYQDTSGNIQLVSSHKWFWLWDVEKIKGGEP